MSSVKFKEHLLVNANLDVAIEDAFIALSIYAGIHSQKFDDQFVEEGADASQWQTGSADGTWTATGGRIRGVGGASDVWQFCPSVSDATKAFVLACNCFVDNDHGAIGFLATDKDNLCYAAWDDTSISLCLRVSSVDTELCVLPKAPAGDRAVTISVQPGEDDDCFISVWFDGQFMANARLETYPAGRKLALGTHNATTIEYDDLRIAELTEVLPVMTMDAGETPLGALQRAIGRRHIRYFMRFNGVLRAWRPKAQATALTRAATAVYSHGESVDRRQVVSHWRQVGAWDMADAYDADLMAAIGHRFHLDENPDLMTEDECEAEAAYNLDAIKENAHGLQADFPMMVFLEPEDRLTITPSDWLLSGYGVQLRAGELTIQAGLRGYIY